MLANDVPGVHAGRVVVFGVMDEAAGTEEVVVLAESAETRGFTKNFGIAGDPTPLDGWGNPIVLISGGAISSYTTDGGVIGVLVSAGPDEDLTTISDNEWQPLSAS